MSTNYETFLRFFEQDPDRFFRELRASIADGTLGDEDIRMLVEKLDAVQPINDRDLREWCDLTKQDPASLRSRVSYHNFRFLYDRGDLDELLK